MATKARSRSRQIGPTPTDVTTSYAVGSGPSPIGNYDIATRDESIDDYVTDNYSNRIARGEIINNPCVYRSVSTTEGLSSLTSFQPPFTGTTVTVTQTGPNTAHNMSNTGTGYLQLPNVTEADIAKAKLQAVANIDSTPYAFGEDALELRETIKFLKRPLTGIHDLTVAWKKRRRKLSRRHELVNQIRASAKRKKRKPRYLDQELAKATLEFQFAASPLYRSVMDIIEVYSSKKETLPPRLTSRGFDVNTSESSDFHKSVSGHNFDRISSRELKVKASILYQVNNPIYDWKYRLGFRVKDVPTTLWQVVPLSFMVDRMFDVSSFSKGIINLLDPNVEILAASVVNRSTVLKQCTYTHYDTNASWSATGSGQPRKYEEFTYNREVWAPSFRDTIPSLHLEGLVKSATNVLELTALIVANLRN